MTVQDLDQDHDKVSKQTDGQISIKLFIDIHCFYSINPNDFGDPPTFLATALSDKVFHFYTHDISNTAW